MISDGLRLTSSLIMNSTPSQTASTEPDPIRRRNRRAVRVNYVSVQLEKAQIHLFGLKSQPSADEEMGEHDDSFFMGLSRLNYVRESETEEKKVSEYHI